jgi:hypothetical protein
MLRDKPVVKPVIVQDYLSDLNPSVRKSVLEKFRATEV